MPHEPPVLRTDQLNQFVERLNLSLPLKQTNGQENGSNVVKKAFAFGFKQPMSNYIAFKVSSRTNDSENNLSLRTIIHVKSFKI